MQAVESYKLTTAADGCFCMAAACLSRAVTAAPAMLDLTHHCSEKEKWSFRCKLSDMIDGLQPDVLAWQIGPAVLLGQAIVEYSRRIGLYRYLKFRDLDSPGRLMPAKQDCGPGSCFSLAALEAVANHASKTVNDWVKEANEMAMSAYIEHALRAGMPQSPEASRPRKRGRGKQTR